VTSAPEPPHNGLRRRLLLVDDSVILLPFPPNSVIQQTINDAENLILIDSETYGQADAFGSRIQQEVSRGLWQYQIEN